MSDTVVDGFVPREAEIIEIREHEEIIRSDERDRRARRFLLFVAPTAVAVFMTVVAGGAMAVMWKRPVPHDRLAVAIVTNGAYEAPTLREDLPQDRLRVLLVYTVGKYIRARENYNYESLPKQQRVVEALSSPQEVQRYKDMLHDERNPENPIARYGAGPTAATATVVAVRVEPSSSDTPNFVEAKFQLRVERPHQPALFVEREARMSFVYAPDLINLAVQQTDDPAGIAFLHYSSSEWPPRENRQ